MQDNNKCPLCRSELIELFFQDKRREFCRCSTCGQIYVPEKYHLSDSGEKARYDLHQNSPENLGYVKFLTDFVERIEAYVSKHSSGLDFGSGPVPVLADILTSRGYKMSVYDRFYSDDRSVFDQSYDFITMVEVVEHLSNPMKEITVLWNSLNPGGVIGIKTKFTPEKKEAFSAWNYKNDLTHICLFSEQPFYWIADTLNSELTFPDRDTVLMFKRK